MAETALALGSKSAARDGIGMFGVALGVVVLSVLSSGHVASGGVRSVIHEPLTVAADPSETADQPHR
jgi:hypothetical protein